MVINLSTSYSQCVLQLLIMCITCTLAAVCLVVPT